MLSAERRLSTEDPLGASPMQHIMDKPLDIKLSQTSNAKLPQADETIAMSFHRARAQQGGRLGQQGCACQRLHTGEWTRKMDIHPSGGTTVVGGCTATL